VKEFGAAILTIVGGILTLAIISVIVGRNSKAPQAIAATGRALSTVIASAVNPVATAATNGNPSVATYSTPQINPQK
jgi:hypothetical protein